MKIYIESAKRSFHNNVVKEYRLKTNSLHMPLISLSGLFWKLVKRYNLDKEPLSVESSKLDEENELSALFCSQLNNALGEDYFTVGSFEECIYSYVQAQGNTIIRIEKLLKKNVSLFDNKIKKLQDTITKMKTSLDFPISDIFDEQSNGFKSVEKIKKLMRELKLYEYSKYIDYLLDENLIECNHPIPLLFNNNLETIGIRYIYYGPNYIDLYPINLAIESNNYPLLKKIICKGGYKFAYKDNSSVNKLTNIILFILKNTINEEDIDLMYKLFELYPKDYQWIFKTNFIKNAYGHNKEFLSEDGNEILIEAYIAILRINSISALEQLLSKHKYWLMKRLQHTYIYAPRTIVNEPYPKLSDEMRAYIREHIEKQLNGYKEYNPHDYSIWGYDSVTGSPIKYSDLNG